MKGRNPHPDSTALAEITRDSPLAAALAYATCGFPVFPLHTPDTTGRCSCRRECGRNSGKHPRTMNGLADATTDGERIRHWWRLWPAANIGVVTGATAGIFVFDIDAATGGDDSIAALEAAHGDLPPTWAVETGGGGLHLFFRHPGGRVRTSAGKLAPGLDIRGDGGYIVAPPSLHRSGRRYAWAPDWRPATVPLADPPSWLMAAVQMVPEPASPLRGTGTGNHRDDPASPIPEGQRNATLASLSGTMRRRGMSEPAILAALLAENAERCQPPLAETEIATIARSIARYPAEARPVARGRRGGFVEIVGGKAVAR